MTGVPADQLDLDWDALEQEMVSLLSEYITLDTSNPPGNEAIAARWFGELLHREGIESEYYESAAGRAATTSSGARSGDQATSRARRRMT